VTVLIAHRTTVTNSIATIVSNAMDSTIALNFFAMKSIVDKILEGDEKMKKFEAPVITVQKLEPEFIMAASNCFEEDACTECYCGLVQCGGKYECVGLVCGRLSDYE